MNYNNTDLYKFLQLTEYDLDLPRCSITYDNMKFLAHIYLKRHTQYCTFCRSSNFIVQSTVVKHINHSILKGYDTIIIFHQYKYKCKECGKLFLQDNPICDTMHSVSYLGKMRVLEDLRDYRTTFQDVANNYNISKSTVIRCFDMHVNIDKHGLSEVICIDEKYSKKLSIDNTYICTLYDPINKYILDILPSRHKDYLIDYFSHFEIKKRLSVMFINIDMWDTYKDVALLCFPNATICVDSFHVIEHLNKAMDTVRLKIQNRFAHDKDENKNSLYWLLKNFHYFLTEDFDKVKYKRQPRSHYSYLYDKYDVLKALLDIDQELANAYKLKEDYREFNICASYEEALEQMDDYILAFKKSYFEAFRDFGNMIERWKYEIINSHIYIKGTRMSNGPIESLNRKLNTIMNESYGFTDFNRFKNKAMFSLNKSEKIKL